MSASQLRLAFTTMVRCVSNSDDALAWYCILQLISAISSIPLSPPTTTPSPPSSSSLTPPHEADPNVPRDFDDDDPTTRLDEASSLSPLESTALQLRRGHLLLTLIDQTTSVNLILLRSLLAQIWEFVKEEGSEEENKVLGEVMSAERGAAGEESGKEALVKIVFNTLGEGLDATKREEGVRYWMEHGQELNG